MLLTGRLGEVRRKLFKALPDTRRYNPESDAYIRMIAGLGRTRVPLTRQELQTQLEEYAEMSGRPMVSVILPVYGAAPHALMLAVNSMLKQTYQEWELHLVLPHGAAVEWLRVHRLPVRR